MRKRKGRAPRGWLLVEVAIGGVMASVILGGLLVNVGDAMDKTTVVGRQITATMLAQQGIEQARAIQLPLVNLADGTNVPVAVPSGLTGTYTRTRTVTHGQDVVNGLNMCHKDVVVTVTFPANDGTTKTTSVETRIYQAGTCP